MQLAELLRAEVAKESSDPLDAVEAMDQVLARGRGRLQKRRIATTVAMAAAVAIAISVSTLIIRSGSQSSGFVRPGPSSSTSGKGSLTARELQLAIQATQHAAGLGLHPPGWPSNLQEAEAVLSDRDTATLTLMHDVSGGGFRKVIVIRMSGTFPWNVSHPPGWNPPTPTANSLIIVIDARTGEGLDSSLGNDTPQISVLGKVVILYRRA